MSDYELLAASDSFLIEIARDGSPIRIRPIVPAKLRISGFTFGPWEREEFDKFRLLVEEAARAERAWWKKVGEGDRSDLAKRPRILCGNDRGSIARFDDVGLNAPFNVVQIRFDPVCFLLDLKGILELEQCLGAAFDVWAGGAPGERRWPLPGGPACRYRVFTFGEGTTSIYITANPAQDGTGPIPEADCWLEFDYGKWSALRELFKQAKSIVWNEVQRRNMTQSFAAAEERIGSPMEDEEWKILDVIPTDRGVGNDVGVVHGYCGMVVLTIRPVNILLNAHEIDELMKAVEAADARILKTGDGVVD